MADRSPQIIRKSSYKPVPTAFQGIKNNNGSDPRDLRAFALSVRRNSDGVDVHNRFEPDTRQCVRISRMGMFKIECVYLLYF